MGNQNKESVKPDPDSTGEHCKERARVWLARGAGKDCVMAMWTLLAAIASPRPPPPLVITTLATLESTRAKCNEPELARTIALLRADAAAAMLPEPWTEGGGP